MVAAPRAKREAGRHEAAGTAALADLKASYQEVRRDMAEG
jgi:hypothetical protein